VNASAAPQQLPRGRHRLSREEVVSSQRMRMLDAMISAVADKGYTRTSVADVISRARVSRETFYEHFTDKEDCFLATFDHTVQTLIGRIRERSDEAAATDRIDRLDGLLRVYLEELAAQADVSRVFLVEVYAAGERAIERRARLQQRFVDIVAGLLEAGDATQRFACEVVVAAVSQLVTTRVGSGRSRELPELREPLVDLARQAWPVA
jgi:AcrR family transcriptional regulator